VLTDISDIAFSSAAADKARRRELGPVVALALAAAARAPGDVAAGALAEALGRMGLREGGAQQQRAPSPPAGRRRVEATTGTAVASRPSSGGSARRAGATQKRQ